MRLKQLDVLRGLAICLVFGRHLPFYDQYSGLGSSFIRLWQKAGWIGVDLFFVLSGFLVSGLLFKEYQASGKINIGLFFIRRGFKIYPAYYFLIFFSFFIYALLSHHLLPLKVILYQLLFVQNYSILLWSHTWSLAVEEHFYFLVGFLLFFCSKRKLSDPFEGLVRLFAVLAVACLLLRLWNACMSGEYTHGTHLFLTHLRIDSLMFGVLLSYWHHFHFVRIKHYVVSNFKLILLLSLTLISPAFLFELERTPFLYTFGLTMLYLGFGGILIAFLYCIELKDSAFNVLSTIGFNSYSIYIWHVPIADWIIGPIGRSFRADNFSFFLMMLLYLALTISIGIGMARLIEMPFLNYRDRVFTR